MREKDYPTADAVIERGYEIYDEWNRCRYTSRKIVDCVKQTADSVRTDPTKKAHVEALAHLFALDMRIEEKYSSFLRCIIFYFSWQRETRALSILKLGLGAPKDANIDVRTLIEVALKKLREGILSEESEDGDDETHGGKRNGKSEEEAVASEEKEQDQPTDEGPDQPDEADEEKEATEEKTEESFEKEATEEAKEEATEQQETEQTQKEELKEASQEETEELEKVENDELNEENNVPDEKSEPSKDKNNPQNNIDTFDLPPLYEPAEKDGNGDKRSFIDEMVIDDMVKGDKSIIGYRRIDEEARNMEADTAAQDTPTGQNEEKEITDKDADLYDKNLATDKGQAEQTLNLEAAQQSDKAEATQPTDKVGATQESSKLESEQPKETAQNNGNVKPTEQDNNQAGEIIRTDPLEAAQHNRIAFDLNGTMSLESKMSYIRMQEELMREHVKITLEELGMNDTGEILRVSEPDKVSPPSLTQNRK